MGFHPRRTQPRQHRNARRRPCCSDHVATQREGWDADRRSADVRHLRARSPECTTARRHAAGRVGRRRSDDRAQYTRVDRRNSAPCSDDGDSPSTFSKPGNDAGNARIRAVIRGAGGAVALAAFSLLANYLRAQLDRRLILKQVDELEPDITSRLALLKAIRTTVQSSGATPWAVVTVDIRTHSFTELGFGPPIKDTSLPVVTLTSVDIGPAQIPTALGSKRTEMVIGTTVEHLPLVWSFAVPLSKGDVDTFRRLTNEYNWCQAALSQDLTPEDQKRVNADLANASSRYAAW